MRKTTKLVYMSLLVAQALVLHIFENMIPVPFATPGAKLGLANLITVIALYTLDKKRDVFYIIILRLALATMFGGNLSSFMYSFSGALLSFLIMIIVKKNWSRQSKHYRGKLRWCCVSQCWATFNSVLDS